MITGHKFRNGGKGAAICVWLGTCGRPAAEHAESVDLADKRRGYGNRNAAAKK